jgi:hypothetical protein
MAEVGPEADRLLLAKLSLVETFRSTKGQLLTRQTGLCRRNCLRLVVRLDIGACLSV